MLWYTGLNAGILKNLKKNSRDELPEKNIKEFRNEKQKKKKITITIPKKSCFTVAD